MERRTGALLALLALLLSTARARAHEPGEVEPPAPSRTAPVLVEKVEPIYPEAARQAGVGGVVLLEITVKADGGVGDVKVVRTAGFGLDEAAVNAARRFRFRAATEEGKPIASLVSFEQGFTIRPRIVAETTAEPATPAPPTSTPAVAAPPSTPSGPRYESTIETRGPLTAASSSTIRNGDFDLRPRSSPSDLLRVVPGLLVVQHQGGGKADQLFLRGFDADHGTDVGLFFDGVPINMPSHAHGQGFADLHWLIPEAIERIDVIKGPYDARWGDFSTGGAINLVSRKGFEESSVQATVGGFPTERGREATSFRFVGIAAPRFAAGTWAEKLHPWVAFEAAQDEGPFQAAMRLRRYNLFAKVSYDFSPRTSVGVFLQGYASGWTGSGQIPSREVDAGRLSQFGAIDPSEGGLTERQMLIAFLHHKDPSHDLDVSAYVTRYRLSLWDNFTFFLRDPVRGDEIEQDDARTFVGANVAYHFHKHWKSLRFRTTLGASLRYDGIHVDIWDVTSQGGQYRKRIGRHGDRSGFHFGSNADIDQTNLSAYAEEDVAFGKYVRAVVGLRADYFGFNVDDKGEDLSAGAPATSGVRQRALLSPKATLVVTPFRLLDLYLNFGMGLHSNDARIAVQEERLTAAGSPTSTVPRIYGGEIGARLNLFDRVAVAAAFWGSYLESETVFVADDAAFVPSDPTRRIGLDLEARAKILEWLYADFDLSWASATTMPAAGGGGALALAPRIYITGGVTVKHHSGVRAGLRVRYLGDRPAFDETSDEYRRLAATQPGRVIAGGHLIFDLYGAYRWRFLEASVSIQNLFNSRWREAQFGNHSCTRDEVQNPANLNHDVCSSALPATQRVGVADVHFTPGVPFNLQVTLKAYF